ncbi:MAG: histidine--tRNA ligase [Elusimicrobiota bacterium]|jgi:histidyl-tRNA synthetase|nr:histidine--tRNA ligase [Elusimicrobiota bacterium]
MAKLVRGFKDVFGQEADALTELETSARKVFKLYGVAELRVPTLELKELFVKSTGDTTDIVQKEMYAFEDAGGRQLALRPEGTPGAARAYIENNFANTDPVKKFFYIGNMFRAERPQAGRYREFEQIGAELIGSAAPAADAEAILLLKDIVKDFGITNYKVKINSLGCKECRPVYKKELIAHLSAAKAELCEKCRERLQRNPLRVLDCKICGPKFTQSAPKQKLCPACAEHYEEVKTLLRGKIDFEEDTTLVRGLDYYTRTVFEFQAGSLGAQNAIAGGGRYDGLIQSMGGPDMPAVGWAMGAERAGIARGEKPAKKYLKIYVVSMDKTANEAAFNVMQTLRTAEFVTLGGLFDKNLKAQMKQADKSGAGYAVILGENEAKGNYVTIKNLETGAQEECPQKELLNLFKLKR